MGMGERGRPWSCASARALTGFQRTVREYYAECEQLARALTCAMSVGLGMAPEQRAEAKRLQMEERAPRRPPRGAMLARAGRGASSSILPTAVVVVRAPARHPW